MFVYLIILFFTKGISVFPVYKIILAEKIDNIYLNSIEVFNMFINSKGIGIKFDNNSEYNIMPMKLLETIKYFYMEHYNNFYYFQTLYKDEYTQLIVSDYCDSFEILHFILEDNGIMIPIEKLFTLNKENNKFTFIFLGKEDEDNIIFGKELMRLMNLKFANNNIIIDNKSFLIDDERF